MMRFLVFWLLFLNAQVGFSAGKDRLGAFALVSAGSLGANLTSVSADVRGWDNVDLQLIVTGTPTGAFFVDCAITAPSPPAVTPTWNALTLSPAPIASGAATNILIELNQTGCQFIRLRYTSTSGTGSLTAMVSAKQV